MAITESNITFGDIPDIIIDYSEHFAYCDLNIKNEMAHPDWKCELKGLTIGEGQFEKFNNNSRIIFEYGIEFSLAPIEYLLKLEAFLFSELVKEHECNFGYVNNYYAFTCQKNTYPLPDIEIQIENWSIKIPTVNLFEYNRIDEEYVFTIYGSNSVKDFTIGRNIMKLFTTVFDKTKNIAGLYSGNLVTYIGKEKIEKVYKNKTSQFLSFFYKAICGILCMGMLFVIAVLIRRRMRRKDKEYQKWFD